MDSFTIVPSPTSHIVHSETSRMNEEGIQAHIFIEKPLDSTYESVEPNSVHLTTCIKGGTFEKFKLIKEENKLVMTLPVYLCLLEFFQVTWPTLKIEIEKKFKLIRRKNYPYELHSQIHFYHSGTAYYERWIGDVFLHYKKCSTDFTAGKVHLRQGGKSLVVNPNVMQTLSNTRSNLLETLYSAGYNDVNQQVETQS
jgi:hypothetical protein